MIVGSIKENIDAEKRVAITPDTIKKYKSLGLEVHLCKGYASHLGISDEVYEVEGANFFDRDTVISNSNAILQMNILNNLDLNKLTKGQILVGVLNPYTNEKKLKEISDKDIDCFSLELLPRITRAQSMDILSSQANLAGYKAVVDSFAYFQKAIPMMMTAAGTISAAKVLVVAGVAGLQLTAERMGAIVYAQIQNSFKRTSRKFRGKFLSVEGSENLETDGGYAKVLQMNLKKSQSYF